MWPHVQFRGQRSAGAFTSALCWRSASSWSRYEAPLSQQTPPRAKDGSCNAARRSRWSSDSRASSTCSTAARTVAMETCCQRHVIIKGRVGGALTVDQMDLLLDFCLSQKLLVDVFVLQSSRLKQELLWLDLLGVPRRSLCWASPWWRPAAVFSPSPAAASLGRRPSAPPGGHAAGRWGSSETPPWSPDDLAPPPR